MILLRILVAKRRIIQVILFIVIVLYLRTIKKANHNHIFGNNECNYTEKQNLFSEECVPKKKKFKHLIQSLFSHIITTLQYKKTNLSPH